jgi:pimeloyl-ACP methyl ester carboxylesterase
MNTHQLPLNVASWGDPGAPVCVCLHGITSNAQSWTAVGPALAGRGLRVLAPEMRGHGESPKVDTGYDTATLLADLRASVPEQMVLLIGHSFGGYLAQHAVLDGLLRPQALLLEDPVSHQPDSDAAAGSLTWDRANLPRDIDGTLALNPRWSRLDAAGKVLSLEQVHWAGARAAFSGNAPWDLRGRAAEVAQLVPAQWVLPGTSRFVPETDVDALVDAVGHGAVTVIPQVGHSIHRDDLGAFLGAVDALLQRALVTR